MARHPAPPERCLSVTIVRRGTGYLLRSRQWVSAPPGECFEFFADARNLEALTPDFLRFRIVSPLPIEMRTGALIEYRLSLGGLPLRWLTRIDDWQPGRAFTDVQLRGPYAEWVHTHTFEPGATGTWVSDEVRYRLPLAPLSSLAHALFVKPRLLAIFEFRSSMMRLLLP